MATLDFYKDDGSKVKLSLADDPANPGQYLPKSAGDLSLGTPGTGEPAHAGGSTGLIGWARDILANGASILAKIAAFGATGAPSANALSVQGPPNQYGTITFTTINQALTLNCEGMASANFYCRSTGTLGIQIQLDYGDGTWQVSEFLLRQPAVTGLSMQYYTVTPELNAWYGCSTKGAKRVRIIAVAWTSGGVFDGVVSASPIYSAVEIAGNTTLSNVTTINTPSSCSDYQTDTATPLGAGATFTGSSRTMVAGNNAFNAYFRSDTSGATFQIEVSTDNTNWRLGLPSVSSTANTPSNQSIKRTTSFYRVVCAAGAAAQSVLDIHSSQTPS